ncbi:MAG: hypothetical protein JRG96_11575 [Deltaproteobacteria bacterium]|nr:hypothetical protein [Deltaproteobacteria bacterium]MBW2419108.1 hypothetical protein [Deltaproteobacteria bacterium]
MKHGALEKLKYDKRLQTRAEWLKAADRDAMEAELPDVASKAASPDQDDEPQPAADAPPEA